MTDPLCLRFYRPGDAARIDAHEPCPEQMLTGVPRCLAYSAVRPATDEPVACLTFNRQEDRFRLWARCSKHLSVKEWGSVLRLGRMIIGSCPLEMVGTCPNARIARFFRAFGFKAEDPAAPYPRAYRRHP